MKNLLCTYLFAKFKPKILFYSKEITKHLYSILFICKCRAQHFIVYFILHRNKNFCFIKQFWFFTFINITCELRNLLWNMQTFLLKLSLFKKLKVLYSNIILTFLSLYTIKLIINGNNNGYLIGLLYRKFSTWWKVVWKKKTRIYHNSESWLRCSASYSTLSL